MAELRSSDITREIIGAAFEVHRALGSWYTERIYEEAMACELQLRRLSVQRQVPVQIRYKGNLVGSHVLDLIVDGQVVVELKAAKDFADAHSVTMISYLVTTGLPVDLLINFAKPSLEFKRLVR